MSNIVYIATSIDGRISSPDGTLDWLGTVPNPEGSDLGFAKFMSRVDAVVMGRLTFETVVGFGLGWHYPIPGIVLSSTLKSVPEEFAKHVQLASGSPNEIMLLAQKAGFENLYIDGGNTIQRFLNADAIDEMIITEVPILLGGGVGSRSRIYCLPVTRCYWTPTRLYLPRPCGRLSHDVATVCWLHSRETASQLFQHRLQPKRSPPRGQRALLQSGCMGPLSVLRVDRHNR